MNPDFGVQTHILDELHQGIGELVRVITAIMREVRPQIVHSHRQKESLLALLAMLRPGRRKRQSKLVATATACRSQ